MNREVELIILAMDEEFIHLRKRLGDQVRTETFNGEKLYLFERGKKQYVAIRGRVGKVATAFHIGKLSEIYAIRRIFNLGTSGGYSKKLSIGDVVIADRVIYHDVDACEFGYAKGQVPGFPCEYFCEQHKAIVSDQRDYNIFRGRVASGDSFITDKNRTRFPLDEMDPLCVEMEAGAVAQCAYLMNIPFVVIRSISDLVYKISNAEDSEFNLDIASEHCIDVLFMMIDDHR